MKFTNFLRPLLIALAIITTFSLFSCTKDPDKASGAESSESETEDNSWNMGFLPF